MPVPVAPVEAGDEAAEMELDATGISASANSPAPSSPRPFESSVSDVRRRLLLSEAASTATPTSPIIHSLRSSAVNLLLSAVSVRMPMRLQLQQPTEQRGAGAAKSLVVAHPCVLIPASARVPAKSLARVLIPASADSVTCTPSLPRFFSHANRTVRPLYRPPTACYS